MRHSFPLVFCTWLLAVELAWGQPTWQHVDVYESGKDGYAGYRIPAIETTTDGSLLAFAEARKYNLADPGGQGQEIDLVLKRSTDQGATWSEMVLIEHSGEYWSSANPATLVDRDTGRIWVFYLRCKPGRGSAGARPGTDDARNLARYSDDQGRTWSEPLDQTAVARDQEDPQWRISVPGPGGAVQDNQGRLIVPMWKVDPQRVFTIFSEDHGQTWQRGSVVPGSQGVDEDQLVVLANGDILLDARQRKGATRWTATSSDCGRTWSEPRRGQTVSPVCCAIERLTLKSAGDDRDRIVWTGPLGPGRQKLVVRTSYDEGHSFVNEKLITAGPAAYSDLTRLADKSIGVLWERANYKFITFTRLSLNSLKAGEQ
jgi:sialidase-1